jgi:hypothetical protein
MYKVGDIVLIKSRAGPAIPAVHVKLIKKIEKKASKGSSMDWPAYVGWECKLTKPEEADLLRKEWSIPFKFPDDINTFVFEEEIIKKIDKPKKKKKTRRQPKSKRKTT